MSPDIERIARLLVPGNDTAPREGHKRSAILMPLFRSEDHDNSNELRALFILRRDLPRFGRQIAFAGGKVEDADESDRTTALRELHEELGIAPSEIDVLGKLGHFPTRTSNYDVAAWIGWWGAPGPCTPCSHEVAVVFSLPLEGLLDQYRYAFDLSAERSTTVESTYDVSALARPYPVTDGDPGRILELPVIWGVTARILDDLFQRLLLDPTDRA